MLSRTTSRALFSPLIALRTTTTTTLPAFTTLLQSQIYPRPVQCQSSSPARPTIYRQFHSSKFLCKGLSPESENPAAPTPEPSAPVNGNHVVKPSELTEQQYRDYSDRYFNVLMAELELRQEEGSDIELEYSAGVMNITVPAIGTYVLNKQPPNKQIWLSSPISGPKRFDWVLQSDQMNEKEGTGDVISGEWIYLRDGSNLITLLNKELGLEMEHHIYGPEK
ncbi:iron donor protein CyaY [Polytolypa hystricis UAMH7299]|uniref:ferroxidase n=1 Tax=Polytolypa hystricis (strain UAMH7299) TaxID=1447883 RepID=A0A2B7Z222_POLH7|nr:iron donor protein CyaY [Polytolypa hystricis UAMH7299]